MLADTRGSQFTNETGGCFRKLGLIVNQPLGCNSCFMPALTHPNDLIDEIVVKCGTQLINFSARLALHR